MGHEGARDGTCWISRASPRLAQVRFLCHRLSRLSRVTSRLDSCVAMVACWPGCSHSLGATQPIRGGLRPLQIHRRMGAHAPVRQVPHSVVRSGEVRCSAGPHAEWFGSSLLAGSHQPSRLSWPAMADPRQPCEGHHARAPNRCTEELRFEPLRISSETGNQRAVVLAVAALSLLRFIHVDAKVFLPNLVVPRAAWAREMQAATEWVEARSGPQLASLSLFTAC